MLPVSNQDKENLTDSSAIALIYNDKRVAVIRNPEFFPHRKEERCSRQFGTSNQGHPYIKVSCYHHCVIIILSLYHLFCHCYIYCMFSSPSLCVTTTCCMSCIVKICMSQVLLSLCNCYPQFVSLVLL